MAYDNERDLDEQDAYDLVNRAKDNVKLFYSNTSDYQDEAMDDTKYMNGDQWTQESKSSRGHRPMPVINDAPTYKRKVQKEYKNSPCGIKVTPVDNDNDPKIARAFQGIVDQIMRDSMGDVAMDKAFASMLDCGMGFSYVDTEYENEHSFNQNLIVNPIKDPFSVFYDINFKRVNMRDMEWGGFMFVMNKSEYDSKYEDAIANGFPSVSEHYLTVDDDTIMLCRYYERSYDEDTLVSFVDPTLETPALINVLVKDLNDPKYAGMRAAFETEDLYDFLKETGRILAKREVEVPKITWYILNDSEILEQGDWVGKYIPIIPTLGEEYKLEGSIYYSSLIRWNKDAGRMYNYHVGNMIETLALSPLTPAIGMAGQFNGHEKDWANANNVPTPYLLFNPVKLPDGTYSTQPPIPTQPAQVPQGNVAAAQMADVDKKNTMGIQDTAMGMDGREQSGKAILARSNEALDNVNVFIQSRKFSTHYLGLVLVDLIPKYYDASRTQRILGVDGSDEMVRINDESAKDYLNIKDAEFDLYIDEGPTFASQRKEEQASYLELAKVMPPEFVQAFPDKMVEFMDISGTKEVTKRVQKLMNPKFFVEEGEKTPEQMENEIAQLTQQVEQITSQNQEMEKVLMGEEQKVNSQKEIAQMREQGLNQREQIKAQTSLQREDMSNRTDIKESEINAENRLQVEAMKQSMSDMSSKIDIIVSKLTV